MTDPLAALPNVPKAEDLVPILTNLAGRIAALEAWRTDHTQSMVNRQAQVNQVRQAADREKWLNTLKPGRR